jgi:hypothetical protein
VPVGGPGRDFFHYPVGTGVWLVGRFNQFSSIASTTTGASAPAGSEPDRSAGAPGARQCLPGQPDRSRAERAPANARTSPPGPATRRA